MKSPIKSEMCSCGQVPPHFSNQHSAFVPTPDQEQDGWPIDDKAVYREIYNRGFEAGYGLGEKIGKLSQPTSSQDLGEKL